MTQCSTTVKHKSDTTLSGWDEAISRVDSEIEKMERYLIRLKAAKKTFQLSKREGMEWPGSIRGFVNKLAGKAGTAKEAVPA